MSPEQFQEEFNSAKVLIEKAHTYLSETLRRAQSEGEAVPDYRKAINTQSLLRTNLSRLGYKLEAKSDTLQGKVNTDMFNLNKNNEVRKIRTAKAQNIAQLFDGEIEFKAKNIERKDVPNIFILQNKPKHQVNPVLSQKNRTTTTVSKKILATSEGKEKEGTDVKGKD